MKTNDLVKCYRDEYRIEHLFDAWVNADIGLLPIFLKKESRIKGLIRFLSIAIRFTVLVQHQVRVQLQQNNETINDIYPGNKGRSTPSPTTAMILRAFRGVSIAWGQINDQQFIQMTPLNPIQEKLLQCTGQQGAYTRILEVLKSYSSLRET